MQAGALLDNERKEAIDLLIASAVALRTATSGLSDAQWRFEPAPGRWAVADIVEHLSKSEQAVYYLVTRDLLKQPVLPADRRSTTRDLAILLAVQNRGVRFQAADLVRPTRTWTTTEGLRQQFEGQRAATVGFLTRTTDDLRGRVADHPVLGVIDAYQWLLFLGAHTHRHIEQLLEVKADRGYPPR